MELDNDDDVTDINKPKPKPKPKAKPKGAKSSHIRKFDELGTSDAPNQSVLKFSENLNVSNRSKEELIEFDKESEKIQKSSKTKEELQKELEYQKKHLDQLTPCLINAYTAKSDSIKLLINVINGKNEGIIIFAENQVVEAENNLAFIKDQIGIINGNTIKIEDEIKRLPQKIVGSSLKEVLKRLDSLGNIPQVENKFTFEYVPRKVSEDLVETVTDYYDDFIAGQTEKEFYRIPGLYSGSGFGKSRYGSELLSVLKQSVINEELKNLLDVAKLITIEFNGNDGELTEVELSQSPEKCMGYRLALKALYNTSVQIVTERDLIGPKEINQDRPEPQRWNHLGSWKARS